LIVVDLQTTGWNQRTDRIVSIGAVDFPDKSRTFYEECRLPPGTKITSEAMHTFRFDTRSLFEPGRPSVKVAVTRFVRWSESSHERTLAGQNSWFDAAFLGEAARRYGIPWTFGYRQVDLHSVCYARLLQSGEAVPVEKRLDALGLGAVLRCVGIRYGAGRHSALENAKLEAEAFSRLILGRALFDEYRTFEVPRSLVPSVESPG